MIFISLVGTGIFAGILGNFYLEGRRLDKVQPFSALVLVPQIISLFTNLLGNIILESLFEICICRSA